MANDMKITMEALSRILIAFLDYKIIFENHYLAANHTHFTRIVEIVIRPDHKEVKIRLGLDDTNIDEL